MTNTMVDQDQQRANESERSPRIRRRPQSALIATSGSVRAARRAGR